MRSRGLCFLAFVARAERRCDSSNNADQQHKMHANDSDLLISEVLARVSVCSEQCSESKSRKKQTNCSRIVEHNECLVWAS